MLTLDEFAQMIDHAVLGPSQTDTDLEEGAKVARKYRVKCFCPNPYQLARARSYCRALMCNCAARLAFRKA